MKACANEVKEGPAVVTDQGVVATEAIINCLGYRYAEGGCQFAPSDKIGPSCFGPLFETTAIPEIRQQARHLAGQILI